MSKPAFTVFFAWESDRPAANHRNLIESAARAALAQLQADAVLEVDPRLDKDTSGVPGTPAIAETIFSKIERADLFLWDGTFVTGDGERPAPNPNVLIELGYAAAKIGWDFIIGVMNEHHGGFSKLPFDLRHRRRPIPYRLTSGASDEERLRVETDLTVTLESAFRAGLAATAERRRWSPIGRAVAHRLRDAVTSGTSPIARLISPIADAERLPMWAMLLQGRSAPGSSDPPDRVAASALLEAVVSPRLLAAHPDPATGYPRPVEELVDGFVSCGVQCRDALKDLGAHAPEPLVLALNELATVLLEKAQRIQHVASSKPLDLLVGREAQDVVDSVLMLLKAQRTWQRYLGN